MRTARGAGLLVLAELVIACSGGQAHEEAANAVEPAAGGLYLSHMNTGRLLVFNLDSSRVLRVVGGVPRVTGVWSVPEHHHVYAAAAGAHEVAVVDDRSLADAGTLRKRTTIDLDGEAGNTHHDSPLGDQRASSAHTVSVDPRSHRVYLPLGSVGGRPVLRVLAPAP